MPDVTWDLTDDSTTYTFDGVTNENPTITVGEEVSFTFILENGGASGGHLSVYNTFKDYDRHLNEKTLDYGNDYQGQPWYRYELHPNASVSTYLFEVVPGADVDGASAFWGLLTQVEDETRLVGGGERLTMTFYVLADGDDYATRSDVQSALQADL